MELLYPNIINVWILATKHNDIICQRENAKMEFKCSGVVIALRHTAAFTYTSQTVVQLLFNRLFHDQLILVMTIELRCFNDDPRQ